MVLEVGYCEELGWDREREVRRMRGGHDALAHTRGEPHGAHSAAHGKPTALKRQ